MASVAHLSTIPMQPPPMTAGEKDMRRDPSFPDVEPDSDVLALLAGPVQAAREQMQFLMKLLANHREIDADLWQGLADTAGDLMNSTDMLLCVEHLREGKVVLGRGRGFDAVLCDEHIDELMGRER